MVGDVQTGHELLAFTVSERHKSASSDECGGETKGEEDQAYVLERRSPARLAKAEVSRDVITRRRRISRASFIHFASEGTNDSGFLIGLSGENILETFGVRLRRLYNFSNSDGPAGSWGTIVTWLGRRVWRRGS